MNDGLRIEGGVRIAAGVDRPTRELWSAQASTVYETPETIEENWGSVDETLVCPIESWLNRSPGRTRRNSQRIVAGALNRRPTWPRHVQIRVCTTVNVYETPAIAEESRVP